MQSTPRKFVKVIQDIATAYGCNLSLDFNHLRLERECYLPLVIEKLGADLLSVAHYQNINGDLVPDPDILFKIHRSGEKKYWIPVEISQVLLGTQTLCKLENGKIIRYYPNRQGKAADFCSMWADNLESQHWHLEQKPNPEITAKSSYFEPITA